MNHAVSAGDARFRGDFEAGRVPPSEFNHRAHLRLAYVYLCEHDLDTAYGRRFLAGNGVDAGKYHETLTRAWMMAVRHFMMNSAPSQSFQDFVGQHDVVLDPKIMLTHYSRDTLFSQQARAAFVEPDIDPISAYR
jgi:hypothetical protein